MTQDRALAEQMAAHLVEAEPPCTHDVLGRPLVGPCLIWSFAAPGPHGYGRLINARVFGSRRRAQLAHRVAFALDYGWDLNQLVDMPALDHLCRVRACCQPRHLEMVTTA